MKNFFGRPTRFFGNRAVLFLCVIFFLTPFALRGAKMALQRMENNVKDWLPDDFPETQDLEWFSNHFIGEQFIVATWPGCHAGDPRFELLVKKLRAEVVRNEPQVEAALAAIDDPDERAAAEDRFAARALGDRLNLFATGDYHERWGQQGERWLLGRGEQWYYVTRDGELYEWSGRPRAGEAALRLIERLWRGKNVARGEKIAQFGEPSRPGRPNEFYRDPRKLTARYFKTIETGPETLRMLTAEGGPLWPRMSDVADEDKPELARREAIERLTGTLFAPAVPKGFDWSVAAFEARLSDEKIAELPEDWKLRVEQFVDRLVAEQFDGDDAQLIAAPSPLQSRFWEQLFAQLDVPPPPRQTCVVATLTKSAKRDLARVVGRPIMGKPPGRLIDLAVNECNIALNELKLGGPPVDNVAIDEEGTITLFRLIGYSAFVGIGLSYACFRSVKVTIMVFFVGGVSAVSSLSLVWWGGQIPAIRHLASVDAVLMSMPSLVYVLGLSGAVHIVNYYRDAVRTGSLEGAPDRALAHGWGPCSLAAFTTALGLVSLYASNLMPIKKFGLFSAIGVLMTLVLLFLYLPSALEVWAPRALRREDRAGSLAHRVERFWLRVGEWVIKRHWPVTIVGMLLVIGVGLGLRKIESSVQLLKLFDPDAKIIQDYRWMENHFGKLVPMELVVRIRPEMQLPPAEERLAQKRATGETDPEGRFQLSLLERAEAVARIQFWVEHVFGETGQDIVGRAVSAVTFLPELPPPNPPTTLEYYRRGFAGRLESSRDELPGQYLQTDHAPDHRGAELWRISLRLGALNDVDYGQFVHQQKRVVEPVLAAYRCRDTLLRQLNDQRDGEGFMNAAVAIVGVPPAKGFQDLAEAAKLGETPARARGVIDQTAIFSSTLRDLLKIAGCRLAWIDPEAEGLDAGQLKSEKFAAFLAEQADATVLVRNHEDLDLELIEKHAGLLVDARGHRFRLDDPDSQTALERRDPIQVVYTGLVPVVYKAQRTLLYSLVDSIGLAFVMITIVMMILLRDWHGPFSVGNAVNLPGGMLSMIPNVFPVVLIFGTMGYARVKVDIGTMMCASVAMGVAVDDTIHFLSWFRKGTRRGLGRHQAVREAYRHVATAMTQTTLIGGLGLVVFAASTFTPTQRFGVMMVTLLATALVGDLVFLPGILASPLGRFFCPKSVPASREAPDVPGLEGALETADRAADTDEPAASGGDGAESSHDSSGRTPHSTARRREGSRLRQDSSHRWPRH